MVKVHSRMIVVAATTGTEIVEFVWVSGTKVNSKMVP